MFNRISMGNFKLYLFFCLFIQSAYFFIWLFEDQNIGKLYSQKNLQLGAGKILSQNIENIEIVYQPHLIELSSNFWVIHLILTRMPYFQDFPNPHLLTGRAGVEPPCIFFCLDIPGYQLLDELPGPVPDCLFDGTRRSGKCFGWAQLVILHHTVPAREK